MNQPRDEMQRAQAYERVKTFCEGVLALMSIAGGPAIVLLAFDPAIKFVPHASSSVVVFALIVGGWLLPMIPVVSFAVSAFPKALKKWQSVLRIIFIFAIGYLGYCVNNAAYEWHMKRNEETLARNEEAAESKRTQSAADRKELRELIEQAVAEKCGPSTKNP